MRKFFIIFLFLPALFLDADAQDSYQDYSHAIGLRFGYPVSISYKKMLGTERANAIELSAGTRSYGYFSSRYREFQFALGYLMHEDLDIENVSGLRWYWGFGGSVYTFSYRDRDLFINDDSYTNVSFGIQGYLGLEYTLKDKPINFTLDWVPTFRLGGYGSTFGADYGALGIRYVLN